jgi:hypothetical protein
MVKQCGKGTIMNKSEKNQEVNETQIFAIYHLADTGLSAADIGKKIKISTKEVRDVLSKRDSERSDAIKTTSSKVNSKDLMITQTAAKGINNVAIMTKAASEINDAHRQTMETDSTSRTTRNAIYRPNNNK